MAPAACVLLDVPAVLCAAAVLREHTLGLRSAVLCPLSVAAPFLPSSVTLLNLGVHPIRTLKSVFLFGCTSSACRCSCHPAPSHTDIWTRPCWSLGAAHASNRCPAAAEHSPVPPMFSQQGLGTAAVAFPSRFLQSLVK